MSFLFVAFSSRSYASHAYQKLLQSGVSCALFSTPTSANLGCGLSIRFNERDLFAVRQVCSTTNGCMGFFRAIQINQKIVVTRL